MMPISLSKGRCHRCGGPWDLVKRGFVQYCEPCNELATKQLVAKSNRIEGGSE